MKISDFISAITNAETIEGLNLLEEDIRSSSESQEWKNAMIQFTKNRKSQIFKNDAEETGVIKREMELIKQERKMYKKINEAILKARDTYLENMASELCEIIINLKYYEGDRKQFVALVNSYLHQAAIKALDSFVESCKN